MLPWSISLILFLLCLLLAWRLRLVSRRARAELETARGMLEKAWAERTREQAQMLHHAKLRAIGELAGGVAHEVNNPLMIISGYSEMIIKILNKPEPALDRVSEISNRIIQTSRRIAFVIQALRNYSHNRAEEEIETHDAAGLLEQALALCKSKIQNAGVDLLGDGTQAGVFFIRFDGGRFLQVLLALILNAVDALEMQERKEILVSLDGDDSRVFVRVRDNGRGVPMELREKIFEPFYSSKVEGGTGLGLSVARTIIEHNGGQLILESEEAMTSFLIALPRVAKPSVPY